MRLTRLEEDLRRRARQHRLCNVAVQGLHLGLALKAEVLDLSCVHLRQVGSCHLGVRRPLATPRSQLQLADIAGAGYFVVDIFAQRADPPISMSDACTPASPGRIVIGTYRYQ